eukprot:scaffold286_cov247-Pinguiococcus_pyrenoidosus.AAC.16
MRSVRSVGPPWRRIPTDAKLGVCGAWDRIHPTHPRCHLNMRRSVFQARQMCQSSTVAVRRRVRERCAISAPVGGAFAAQLSQLLRRNTGAVSKMAPIARGHLQTRDWLRGETPAGSEGVDWSKERSVGVRNGHKVC